MWELPGPWMWTRDLFSWSLTLVGSGGARSRDTPDIPPCAAAGPRELSVLGLLLGRPLPALQTSGPFQVGDSCVSNKAGEEN